MTKYKFKRLDAIATLIILLFFIINLATLMGFPSVHSDELWLKGIAEEMIDAKSFSVTEPFYDLYPRVIHPFRWLYNGVLILFLEIFAHSVAAVRLVSLIFATLSLVVFYWILRTSFENRWFSRIGLLLLALDIQFTYSAHMGRQETFILFLMLLGYYQFHRLKGVKSVLCLSSIILLGMGVHPNSFILAVSFAALYFVSWLLRLRPLSDLFGLIGVTSIGVFVYGGIGYLMNPTFLSEYLGYGAALGVDASPINRFEGFYWYWYKLFHQIGGTYDLFDIRWQLIIAGLLLVIWTPFVVIKIYQSRITSSAFKGSVFKSASHEQTAQWGVDAYALLIAIPTALLIIGRYNQTAVVFIMPFVILLLLETLSLISAGKILFHKKSPITAYVFFILLASLWAYHLFYNLQAYDAQRFYTLTYDEMLGKIESVVPNTATVLGNLNVIEAFDSNRFYDVRNLGYLEENALTIEDYLAERHIEYVIWHEEMDYIARTSPRWDFLYVSIEYDEAFHQYLSEHAVVVDSFENPLYAMRISKFSGTYPWMTTIYKLDN